MSNDNPLIASASRYQAPPVPDRKVARINAAAEQKRLDAAARVEEQARQHELDLQRRRDSMALKRERRTAKANERRERQAARGQARAQMAAKVHAAVPTIGRRSMIVGPIGAPMTVAWIGQIGFALDVLRWWLIGAFLFAAGWELSTAFCGWMYHQARDDGDQGTIFRAATWFFAGSAGAMNYWHALDGNPITHPTPKAVSFGAMSLAGIGLWELYTLLIHRKALRRQGKLPESRPKFGTAHWAQFPRITWTARKLSILHGYTTVDQAWSAALTELAHRNRVNSARKAAAKRAKARKKNAKAGRLPVRVTAIWHRGPKITRRFGVTAWTAPPVVWIPTTQRTTVVDHSQPVDWTTTEPVGRTTGETTSEPTREPMVRTTSGATSNTTPEPTDETIRRPTSRTTGKAGSKRRRRTREQLRAQLKEKVTEIAAEGGEIQVKPLADELRANRKTVRELLDEMGIRPMVRKAANE